MISPKSYKENFDINNASGGFEVPCPGCGLVLPAKAGVAVAHYNNSPECEQLLNELFYYTLSLQDADFIHQLAVDAYPAQHYGPRVKPITITFGLLGMYLVNEKGYTGHQVQQAHILLAARNKDWPAFTRPVQKATFTIGDVMQAPPGTERDLRIKSWNRAVWEMWADSQEQVRQLAKQYLFDWK